MDMRGGLSCGSWRVAVMEYENSRPSCCAFGRLLRSCRFSSGLLKASQKVDTLMDKFVHYLVVLYEVDCSSVLFDEVFYLLGGFQACHLFAEVEGLCGIQEFYCQDFLRVVDNAI